MTSKVRVLIGCFLVAGTAFSAGVRAAELSGADLEFWRLNWRGIAQSFAKVGDDFHASLEWDARFPSSYRSAEGERQNVDQWTREHTESQRITSGGFSKVVKQIPLKEEAEAAVLCLPQLAVGHYGQIHSAMVVEVLGPQEMVVRDIWTLDAAAAAQKDDELQKADQYIRQKMDDYRKALEKASRGGKRPQPPEGLDKIKPEIEWRYTERMKVLDRQKEWEGGIVKLLGFSTAGALPGRRWTAPGRELSRIAIVGEQDLPSRSRARRTALTAVNADAFRAPLSEEDFKGMLQSRGIDPVQFVTEARKFMKDSSADPASGPSPRRMVVELIEKAKPQTQVAAGGAISGSRVTLEPPSPDETDDWFIRRSGRSSRAPIAPVETPAPLPQL